MKKAITKNPFLKVFSYNSVVVLGRLIASFIVSKISAIYLGPSGYAIVGNLKSMLQGIFGITSTGFQSGVIKYVTDNKANNKDLKVVVASVTFLGLLISTVVSVFIFIFSKEISVYVLKSVSYSYIFNSLAVALPLITLSFLTVYIVNGLQQLKLYTLIVTFSNILNAVISFILIYYYQLDGALLASIIVPACGFLFSFVFKEVRNIYSNVFGWYKIVSVSFIKSISAYLFMAIYSSVLISLSYLLIRNEIIAKMDTFNAGLWEAMNKVSSFYMIFFSSLFTLFLLPELTQNKTVRGYFKLMKNYFKYVIPFMLIVFLVLYLLKVIVIKVVLTDEFTSIQQFFALQFIGDFIKIIAFSFAYQFHAKKMVKFYVISDFVLYVSFYVLSVYFIRDYNLFGVYYAYIASVMLYLISVLVFIFRSNSNYLERHVS